MFRIIPAVTLALVATTGFGAVNVIEGFENSSNPGVWGASSNPLHTVHMVPQGDVPAYVTTDVTEGSQAGRFNSSAGPIGPVAENVYEPGGPSIFYAVRYNINAPGGLANNSIPTETGILEADITNNSPVEVQVSLVVDSADSSQLERGPLVPIPAGESITYTWNFATTPPVGFDTGDGVLSGENQRLKSLLIYSPVGGAQFDVTVDNIRDSNAPETPEEESPQILFAVQGASVGSATIKFDSTPGPHAQAYGIFVADDSHFSDPTLNRLTFPADPHTTVPTDQNMVTLTGLPTDQTLYFTVRSIYDGAALNTITPTHTAAVRLGTNPGVPYDSIVLDANQFAPGSADFMNNAYNQAVVYTAQALADNNRSFNFYTSEAVDTNEAVLAASPSNVIVWSNLRDGETPGTSLSAQSQAVISGLLADGANIVLSGSSVGQDLGATAGLLESTLKATLTNGDIGIPTVVLDAQLGGAQFLTNFNPLANEVAYGTSANDGLLPVQGVSVPLAYYGGIPSDSAVAAIGYQASLAYLGFAFETAGAVTGPDANSRQVRHDLMDALMTYLLDPTAAGDWQLYR